MKQKTLMHSSIIAAIIIAAVVGVGMVTGFPGAKPFISVDPLSDKNAGDPLTITGTTNLPAGTDLAIQVYATSFEEKASDTGEFSGALGTVEVVSGTGGINTWSMDVDTSVFVPMEYLVNASVFTGDPAKGDYSTGSPFGTTTFIVRPAPEHAGTPQNPDHTVADGILIDPIRDTIQGDPLVVSGKTNLSAGTDLLVQVVPVSLQQGKITGDYQHPENRVMIKVVQGSDLNNLFSVSLDTRHLPLADHIVTVSNMEGNAPGINSKMGSITGSEVFNIIAGTAGTSQTGSNTAVSGSSGQYIKVDPVADKTTGDLLIVTGSTNFPSGTILMVQVGSNGIGVGSDTMVRAGTGGINRYSMPADTSLLKPGMQTITVTNMKGDPEKGDYGLGNVNSTATFTLKGTYRGTDTQVQAPTAKDNSIRLDAIGDKKVGDQFLITGTTSLPAGVNLIWEVMPYTGTMPTGLDLDAKGIMANNPVTKGDGAANRVSLAADMSNMDPGEYIVMVGPMEGDPENRNIAMGEPVGSTRFILK